MVIDSHIHLWEVGRFNYAWMPQDPDCILCHDYLPEDLKRNLDACSVDKAIVVQADVSMAESNWLIELANQYDYIAGVVAWVDLHSDSLKDDLERLMQSGKLVGVRHPLHDEVEDDWILQDKTIRGLQVLAKMNIPYDLLIRPQHLPNILKLHALVPNLKLVINHLAKPVIAEGLMQPWADDLAALAEVPEVHCKLSGMVTEADFARWPTMQDRQAVLDSIVKDIQPYVRTICNIFGMDRVMWGSDWPVCNLAASYAEVYQALLSAIGEVSEQDKSALMGLNSAKFYNLNA